MSGEEYVDISMENMVWKRWNDENLIGVVEWDQWCQGIEGDWSGWIVKFDENGGWNEIGKSIGIWGFPRSASESVYENILGIWEEKLYRVYIWWWDEKF